MKLCHFSEFEAETESFAGLAADVKCDWSTKKPSIKLSKRVKPSSSLIQPDSSTEKWTPILPAPMVNLTQSYLLNPEFFDQYVTWQDMHKIIHHSRLRCAFLACEAISAGLNAAVAVKVFLDLTSVADEKWRGESDRMKSRCSGQIWPKILNKKILEAASALKLRRVKLPAAPLPRSGDRPPGPHQWKSGIDLRGVHRDFSAGACLWPLTRNRHPDAPINGSCAQDPNAPSYSWYAPHFVSTKNFQPLLVSLIGIIIEIAFLAEDLAYAADVMLLPPRLTTRRLLHGGVCNKSGVASANVELHRMSCMPKHPQRYPSGHRQRSGLRQFPRSSITKMI
jgi:hypothetical protein